MAEKWNGVPVRYDLLPIGTRRNGEALHTKNGKPSFAVIHDTGNPNSTAQDNVNYYKNTYNIGWSMVASAHIFVDDKEAIICIPVTEVAWHVMLNTTIDNQWYNADADYAAFGVEACYFTDKKRSLKSLDNAARIMAYLTKFWKINYKNEMPGHQDIQYDKQDPGNLLEACGLGRNTSIFDGYVAKYIDGVKVPKVSKKKAGNKGKNKEKPKSKPSTKDYQSAINYMYSLKGKFVDFDNRWAYQCMDLAVDYVYHITNGKVRMWGNAKDSILNIFPKGWKIVKNTSDYIPPVGAIGVCTYGIYQRYGHIYLVWDNSGGTNTQTVLEQNFDGNADTPAKLRVDNFYGTTHYIVPSFVDEDYDVNKIKTVTTRKATNKYNGKRVPKNLVWSKTPHYIAKADSAGVTICKDVKNGYMKKTNMVYKAGYSPFYVYEVREGWARVYSESSNYWVWHERLIITKEYKHNETRDGKKASKQTKEMKKIAKKSKNKLSIGQIPPKKLGWQRKKYFAARADSFGATILNRHGGKGNYSWNMTNTTYGKGQLFYIYEIIDGWCRVHGPSDNYWVWHERLRITKVY
ncbi:N-acetylmuramoyl-L-alanine amidase [Staphylococcus epidermidis]|uniref:N-acetylmuramoyl-L-alanine amidase n=1 Tax=Staphylococcus epidermidis TaxID=1282 RepID=UPI000D1CCF75|nr:N-acetylmuramoyl-L-alanine amidase [Staphylococcus epidermidis]PTE92337.1 N-acetylmuramoyl-L-alanine amidase [Staphylococcus epidermidis]